MRINECNRLEEHNTLKCRIYITSFQRGDDLMQIKEKSLRLGGNIYARFLNESQGGMERTRLEARTSMKVSAVVNWPVRRKCRATAWSKA